MICTEGIWIVREGREEDFERRWQEGADGIALEYPDITFRLFRDRENPQRFVSLGEGWRTVEQVDEIRSSPTFQDSVASIWRLLDSGAMSTLELVAEIS